MNEDASPFNPRPNVELQLSIFGDVVFLNKLSDTELILIFERFSKTKFESTLKISSVLL